MEKKIGETCFAFLNPPNESNVNNTDNNNDSEIIYSKDDTDIDHDHKDDDGDGFDVADGKDGQGDQGDQDDRVYDNKHQDTRRGLNYNDIKSRKVKYPIGFSINKMWHVIMGKRDNNYLLLCEKYETEVPFWGTVAFVCDKNNYNSNDDDDGDGGDDDGVGVDSWKDYVVQQAQDWALTKDVIIDKVLTNNKDLSKEFLDRCDKMYRQGMNMTDENEINNYQRIGRTALLSHCIIASSQDGVSGTEIDKLYKIAQNLDLEKKYVKHILQCLRMEKTVAQICFAFLSDVTSNKDI